MEEAEDQEALFVLLSLAGKREWDQLLVSVSVSGVNDAYLTDCTWRIVFFFIISSSDRLSLSFPHGPRVASITPAPSPH